MLRATLFAAAMASGLLAGPAVAEQITIGVTPGMHAQIMEKVKEVAAADGLDIQIMEFSDYVVPNQALNDGQLQANSFQTQPYLENQMRDRGFDLVNVGWTINLPMAAYSNRYQDIADLPNGASIAIPNDPINLGRALSLLAANDLIEVDESKGARLSLPDITSNPRNFSFIELEAAQLPRSREDVDLAVINTNYALSVGLNPATDSILREEPQEIHNNMIAVRTADKDAPWVTQLVNAYHSQEVADFIQETWQGAVFAVW